MPDHHDARFPGRASASASPQRHVPSAQAQQRHVPAITRPPPGPQERDIAAMTRRPDLDSAMSFALSTFTTLPVNTDTAIPKPVASTFSTASSTLLAGAEI